MYDWIKENNIKISAEDKLKAFLIIKKKVGTNSYKFKSTRNFADIYAQQKQFWVDVKINKKEVKKQFPRLDLGNIKDQRFTHIRWNQNTNIDNIVTVVKQAFENTR